MSAFEAEAERSGGIFRAGPEMASVRALLWDFA